MILVGQHEVAAGQVRQIRSPGWGIVDASGPRRPGFGSAVGVVQDIVCAAGRDGQVEAIGPAGRQSGRLVALRGQDAAVHARVGGHRSGGIVDHQVVAGHVLLDARRQIDALGGRRS